MRLIDRHDHEMLKTIKLSIKMTGKDKMSDYFREKIETGENPADAWFYYGLNAWEMMNATTQSQKKHEFLVEALKGFEEACALEEKHWPGLFLRSLIRTMMSGDEVDQMVIYLLPSDYTVEDAYNDLDKLIGFQKGIKPEPYFFVPYTCIADRMLELDEFEKAKRYIKEGLTDTPAGRAPYLDSLLSIPVTLFYNKLLQLKHMKLALRVKHRFDILFPGIMKK
jgi:hypothetical protein